ncbi:MAG: CPBP family intramembrane metalloprotease [Prolixibacteraceae bacterium]|nr:CPBP family intramembrane metalloprotease [Prolixibacteraceae bacterium]
MAVLVKKLLKEPLPVAAGTFVFSFFIHAALPWKVVAFIGLFAVAIFFAWPVTSFSAAMKRSGITFRRETWWYIPAGLFTGFLISIFYRMHLHQSLMPGRFTLFAFTAAGIGITEELVFRGYIQGLVKKINGWFAVVFASLSHTLYKVFLFVSPFVAFKVDILFLAGWTFAAGIIFGILTKFSKSVIPALLAHVIFDLWIYGQVQHAPWWVW